MRDSANFSQVISPLLAATEQRWRSKAAEQEAYQERYDNALMANQVWTDDSIPLTDVQKQLRNKYLSSTITDEELNSPDFLQLSNLMKNEILKRQAALKGVVINPQVLGNQSDYYSTQ